MSTTTEFKIIDDISKKQHTVFCEELLRDVPGKRSVYRGKWQDKSVIIKIFKTCLFGKNKLMKEFNGLVQLKERNINSPEMYFYGRSEHNSWVMVTEEIQDGETAIELYDRATTKENKSEILQTLVDKLAKLNKCGIIQTDLHMGNFLVKDKLVYPLDTGQMRFFHTPLEKRHFLEQIAILIWYCPFKNESTQNSLINRYADGIGIEISQCDRNYIHSFAAKHIKKTIKKGLKKCLRTSKRQIKVRAKNYLAVIDRDFHYKTDVESLIENIDTIIEHGKVLKDGRACFASSLDYQGFKIVAKRYNNKGLLHSIKRTIRLSRGRKAWLNGHLLTMLGIITPKPLAFINIYKNHLISRSYIITELVEGLNLHFYLDENNISDDEKKKIKQELQHSIYTLHKNHITHGDIKRSNILITENSVYITDLDAMKKHKIPLLYSYRKNKDNQKLKIMCEGF